MISIKNNEPRDTCTSKNMVLAATTKNQFMEWTDEQIHTPGGILENWPEAKVKEALHNHMKGRQNAKDSRVLALHLQNLRALVYGFGLRQNAPQYEAELYVNWKDTDR